MPGDGLSNRRQFAQRVNWRLAHQMRADGQRTDRRITDGVTVAGGAGGQFHAELQRAARPVVDDHLLAEFAREFGGDDARDVVG